MTVVVNPCTCLHAEHSHYLIRCGCANDRGPKHPMHQMDDAFHRVWCSECLIYCYHPPSCPGLHSTTCVNYLNATLRGLQTSLRVFLSFAFTRLGRLIRPIFAAELRRRHR